MRHGLLMMMVLVFSVATSAGEVPSVPADVAEPPEHAEMAESGLAWVVLEEGEGERRPAPEDEVTVHYTGWQTDGEQFDSSHERGEPVSFRLGDLIDGWVEGVGMMTQGEVRRLWIPGEMAYDGRDDRPDAPRGMLVFEVELLDIEPADSGESEY